MRIQLKLVKRRTQLEKLENFIFENKNISEALLLSFMTNNEEINNNKIIDLCLSGKPKEALLYFNDVYDNSVSNIGIVRQFGNQIKLIENSRKCYKKHNIQSKNSVRYSS